MPNPAERLRALDEMKTIALGFRVKSGYAIAVALRGPAAAPNAIARAVVELCDPDAIETRQPFHHGFSTHEEDERQIAQRVKIVERCARQSVAALLEDERFDGFTCRGAGLVVGSVIDPATVGNPHIRAHASQGRLFRSVLESALQSHGIACDVIVEKQLSAQAATRLRRGDAALRTVVAGFGKTLGGPWRALMKNRRRRPRGWPFTRFAKPPTDRRGSRGAPGRSTRRTPPPRAAAG